MITGARRVCLVWGLQLLLAAGVLVSAFGCVARTPQVQVYAPVEARLTPHIHNEDGEGQTLLIALEVVNTTSMALHLSRLEYRFVAEAVYPSEPRGAGGSDETLTDGASVSAVSVPLASSGRKKNKAGSKAPVTRGEVLLSRAIAAGSVGVIEVEVPLSPQLRASLHRSRLPAAPRPAADGAVRGDPDIAVSASDPTAVRGPLSYSLVGRLFTVADRFERVWPVGVRGKISGEQLADSRRH